MIDEKLKNDISSIAVNSQELLDRCISSLDEIDRANAKAIADIKAQTNSLVKTFSTNLIFNVGATQEYKDLDDAIKECLKYKNLNTKITIVLKDFVFSRQYKYAHLDLSYVIITSENQVIQVDYNNQDPYAVVVEFYHTKAPLFNKLKVNIQNKVSFIAGHRTSFIELIDCGFSGGFSIVRIYSNSYLRTYLLTIDASTESLYAAENSRADILYNTFSNLLNFGIGSRRLAPVWAVGCKFSACASCFKLWTRGVIFSDTTTKDTSPLCNVASNTMTVNGIIYE